MAATPKRCLNGLPFCLTPAYLCMFLYEGIYPYPIIQLRKTSRQLVIWDWRIEVSTRKDLAVCVLPKVSPTAYSSGCS